MKQPKQVEGWPYKFSLEQLKRLRRAGCKFDADDFNRAHHLFRLGYSAAELVRAHEDVRRYAGGDTTQLLAIAAFRTAGFNLARYAKHRASGHGLTAYYNQNFAKGTRVQTAGWVLTVVGLALATLTGAFLIAAEVGLRSCMRRHAGDDTSDDCYGIGYGLGLVINGSLAGLGGLTALIGGILVLTSWDQPYRYMGSPVLDNADAETLHDFYRWRRVADGKPPATTLSLSPLFTRGGAGLALQLRF